MRFSPTAVTNRFRAVADRLARGSAVPAGTDPAEREQASGRPSSRERGAMRRRLRQQRKLRDALLMELGALVMEAHRHGRDDAAVIKSKAAEAAAVDAETVALAETLDEGAATARVTATGLAATCEACGGLVATRARFCEHCGTDLAARPVADAETATVGGAAPEGAPAGGGDAPAENAADPGPAAPAPSNGDGETAVLEPVDPAEQSEAAR